MDASLRKQLIEALVPVIRRAGASVLTAWRNDVAVKTKKDGSPVTAADLSSHAILCDGCRLLFRDIPVVSEEDTASFRNAASTFLVIDPIDGTKEFIKGRNEFTINIGLVENGRPTAGLIYAPALERLFFSHGPGQAFEENASGECHGLAAGKSGRRDPVVLVSRSHPDPRTEALIVALQPAEVKPVGSSLKFALVAAGEADLYPRLGPTMMWDSAAGQAIIEAAGGAVLRPDGSPLAWEKDAGQASDGFIAARTSDLAARSAAILKSLKV